MRIFVSGVIVVVLSVFLLGGVAQATGPEFTQAPQYAYSCTPTLKSYGFVQTEHRYEFTGACTDANGTGPVVPYEVTASYHPATKTGFEALRVTKQGMKVTYGGQAQFSDDPWINSQIAGTPTQLQTTRGGEQYAWDAFGKLGITYKSFDSTLWLTPGQQTAMRAEAAKAPPLKCDKTKLPVIQNPANGTMYPATVPVLVNLSASFPCRFASYNTSEKIQFQIVGIARTGAAIPPVTVTGPMTPSSTPADQVSYGSATTTVSQPGYYSVKARAVFTDEVYGVTGESSWSVVTNFWVGDKFPTKAGVMTAEDFVKAKVDVSPPKPGVAAGAEGMKQSSKKESAVPGNVAGAAVAHLQKTEFWDMSIGQVTIGSLSFQLPNDSSQVKVVNVNVGQVVNCQVNMRVRTPPIGEINETDVNRWGTGNDTYKVGGGLFFPGPPSHQEYALVDKKTPKFTWADVQTWKAQLGTIGKKEWIEPWSYSWTAKPEHVGKNIQLSIGTDGYLNIKETDETNNGNASGSGGTAAKFVVAPKFTPASGSTVPGLKGKPSSGGVQKK